MLVLSRKQKQQIKIGDDVVVTVLQIKGGSVRIGIEAPREVHVMRGELEDFRQPAPVKERPRVLAMSGQSNAMEESAEIPSNDGLSNDGLSNDGLSGDGPSSDGPEESSSQQKDKTVLELRFHGGGDEDTASPTRLTEIANSIPSLNLPR